MLGITSKERIFLDSCAIHSFYRATGKQIHTMVAHLDAVTSLSIDPTGLYLLSGSKSSLYSYRFQCLNTSARYFWVHRMTKQVLKLC